MHTHQDDYSKKKIKKKIAGIEEDVEKIELVSPDWGT